MTAPLHSPSLMMSYSKTLPATLPRFWNVSVPLGGPPHPLKLPYSEAGGEVAHVNVTIENGATSWGVA